MSTLSIVSTKYRAEQTRIKIFLINTHVVAALRVITSLYQNPEKGMRKKSEYEQNIGLSEAFLEAVPTTIIILSSPSSDGKSNHNYPGYNSDSDFKLSLHDQKIGLLARSYLMMVLPYPQLPCSFPSSPPHSVWLNV